MFFVKSSKVKIINLIILVGILSMVYLPTFYKIKNEAIARRLLRYSTVGAPVALWGIL
jgi:hypothetical protein